MGQAPVSSSPKSSHILLKTGEVLRRAGISRQVFYQYLTLGLIEEAVQKPTGHRLFHESVIRRIQLIKGLNGRYPLREIKEIFFKDRGIASRA